VNKNIIKINHVFENGSVFKITPASVKRKWMDDTEGHAYRCLPLNIANQYGWVVHSPTDFVASWNGENGLDAVKIYPENTNIADSHFGHGILTIMVDFVITTDKNISIYVKGVSNYNKNNIYALEGIVETDWLPFTFTMNYQFHTPGAVSFKKDEPLFMFFPIDRSRIEEFEIEKASIYDNEKFGQKYKKYSTSRQEFLETHPREKEDEWQKFYVKGRNVDETEKIENHKVKLKLSRLENDNL